ncbi:MAG: hydroxypyruvate isomerase family protein [Terriglobia bacterium]
MDRRSFTRNLAGAALGAAALASTTSTHASPPTAQTPLKLSVMLWTVFRHLPFEQRLEKVSDAGYHHVELVGEFKKWSAADWDHFSKKKRSLGMTFDATSGVNASLADPSQRPAFLSQVREMLPVMDKLECPTLIVLSGNTVPGLMREAQHESCIEGLRQASELIKGRQNLRILLENIDPEENPHIFLWSVAEGFEITRAVNNPQIKLLYDFYHEQIAEGNLIEKLEKNIDQVGLVHIADVPGRHEPGTGEIHYPNIIKTLAQLGYSHYAAMEYLPTYDGVQSLRNSRRMALESAQAPTPSPAT